MTDEFSPDLADVDDSIFDPLHNFAYKERARILRKDVQDQIIDKKKLLGPTNRAIIIDLRDDKEVDIHNKVRAVIVDELHYRFCRQSNKSMLVSASAGRGRVDDFVWVQVVPGTSHYRYVRIEFPTKK